MTQASAFQNTERFHLRENESNLSLALSITAVLAINVALLAFTPRSRPAV